MKHIINQIPLFILLWLSSQITNAQNNGIIEGRIYFEDTVDFDAEPPDSINNIAAWFMSNMTYRKKECLDYLKAFYFDIYVLDDGRVTKWALIQENDSGSCEIARIDTWKIPPWTPAQKNGQPCNQHIKSHVFIHLE